MNDELNEINSTSAAFTHLVDTVRRLRDPERLSVGCRTDAPILAPEFAGRGVRNLGGSGIG